MRRDTMSRAKRPRPLLSVAYGICLWAADGGCRRNAGGSHMTGLRYHVPVVSRVWVLRLLVPCMDMHGAMRCDLIVHALRSDFRIKSRTAIRARLVLCTSAARHILALAL